MDKIAELCAAEQKYIEKLQLVAQTYSRLVFEAADPEVESYVRLDNFPYLLNQQQEIFGMFGDMLEVHSDLFEFWTHSVEEYLNVDRCGQLFYHALLEERFNVYLHHIVGNPLRHRPVQEDLTGFIENSIEGYDNDCLLLTGYECFRLPLDHLQYYGRAFAELIDSQGASLSVRNAAKLLQQLLQRIEEASKLSEIRNLQVFLPRLGTYLMSAEFSVRDYKEGQHHRAALYLFIGGVLLAKQKGLTLFRRNSDLEFDSFYTMNQIELDIDCFRLKDATTKLTAYKVMEKRRELLRWDACRSMETFLVRMRGLKETLGQVTMQSNELRFDLGDGEVINIEAIKRRQGDTSGDELQLFKTCHLVRKSRTQCESMAEAFNNSLCNAAVINRHDRGVGGGDFTAL